MELHGEEVAPAGSTCKREWVKTIAGDNIRLRRLRKIAVHEVKTARICNPVPQRVPGRLVHLVPADVRDFELVAEGIDQFVRRKPPYPSRQQPETGRVALFAELEEHLQADADSEEGLFTRS